MNAWSMGVGVPKGGKVLPADRILSSGAGGADHVISGWIGGGREASCGISSQPVGGAS